MSNGNYITVHDKIHRRSGHVAVAYKGNVVIWGGYMEHVQETSQSPSISEYHSTKEVWVYNSYSEVWSGVPTYGDIPPRNSGSCGVVLDSYLYVFGGYHGERDPGSMEGNSNQLYRLNLDTMIWEWLHPSGEQPAPCDKLVGWEYKQKLYFFGGFGPPPTGQYSFQHTLDVSTQSAGWPRGWNNQLVCFNPQTVKWEWPRAKGIFPSPRAAHAADKVGSKIYIFGGRYLRLRTNDLHCLDMETLCWSGNLLRPYELKPQGRSWHTFTFISPTQAVLYGGLNQNNAVLNDCWMMEISETQGLKWHEVELAYDHGEPRCYHGGCVVAPGELVIHSGVTQPYYVNRVQLKDHAEELLVLNFVPKTLVRLCLEAALKYAPILEKEYHLLPKCLQKILRMRLDQWQMYVE